MDGRASRRVLVLGMGSVQDAPGGLNRYAQDLTNSLRARGTMVEVVIVGPSDDDQRLIGAAPRHANLGRRLVAVGMEGRARARAADVVNSHFALYTLPVLMSGACRPLVVNFQGPWHREAAIEEKGGVLATGARKAVESFVYRRADEFIVLSAEFRELLIEDFGIMPSRVHVIPPGVDLDRFRPGPRPEARARLGLPEDGVMAVATRRLARRMGLDVLIQAWAQADVGDAVLYLVGDGAERQELEQLAGRLGVAESVRFVGRVSEEDLPLWYAAADFSVVPSVALEGFGLVVLESLACGTPVVASRTGGMAEVLADFSPSLLVEPSDVAALASQLTSLVKDPQARPDRQECRRFAERFNWPDAADRVIQVFDRGRSEPPQRPYRVVYLDHCARLSGGELALARLLPAQPSVEAHVILAEHGPLEERLLSSGISCEVLPLSPRAANLARQRVLQITSLLRGSWTTAVYVARLARRLRQLRPDIVHTNSLKSGIYGALAARAVGIPVVWHVRDLVDSDNFGGAISHALRRIITTLPSAVIANSSATAGALPNRKVPVAVVPSPIDVYRRARSAEQETVVGIVGRLAPWKGQHVFLDAVAMLAPAHPDLRARIIGSALFGEEEYARGLRDQAETLGISDRVDFTGFREDVAAELSQLAVAVHASTMPEPFGQVVVEAMACGVPLVAAAEGGPAEVITEGVNGLLVRPGDADALAAAIDRLLRDDDLRAQLSQAGLETAERYRPERVASEVEAVYGSVLAAHRHTGK